jgi:TPR repeat protein
MKKWTGISIRLFLIAVLVVVFAACEKDYTKNEDARLSFAEAMALAEKGDPDGELLVGVAYVDGNGVPQDDREAMKWLLKAAEKGEYRAMTLVGYMYCHGRGVNEDSEEGIKWLRKAAEKNHPMAEFLIGVMYETGKGFLWITVRR